MSAAATAVPVPNHQPSLSSSSTTAAAAATVVTRSTTVPLSNGACGRQHQQLQQSQLNNNWASSTTTGRFTMDSTKASTINNSDEKVSKHVNGKNNIANTYNGRVNGSTSVSSTVKSSLLDTTEKSKPLEQQPLLSTTLSSTLPQLLTLATSAVTATTTTVTQSMAAATAAVAPPAAVLQPQGKLKKRPGDWFALVGKSLFIIVLHLFVTLYTYLTLPIYWMVQKPWRRLAKANFIRSEQTDKNDPASPWVSHFASKYPYVLDKVNTIDELVASVGEYFNLDRRALGYRRVLREEVVTGPDGKTPLRIDGRTVKKRVLSDYNWISYEEMIKRKNNIARGFHLAGVNQRDRVVILCETCAEYLMVELAIANAGAVQVNVFSTLGDAGIAHAIKETDAKYIFTSFELLSKTRSIIEADKLNVKKVFYIPRRCEEVSEEEEEEGKQLVSSIGDIEFVSLVDVELDGEERGAEVEHRCKPIDKDEIAFIMYTSGTTGVPKGVQATSYQFVQLLHAILPVLAHIMGTADKHMYVAYLPQAHIFEATCEFLAIALGAPLGFATPFTLTDSAPGLAKGTPSDLRLLQPTIMIAVPLVLERMRKEIFAKLEARTPISAPMFNYLMDYKIRWTAKGYSTPIVNKVLCSKIREQFGGRLEKLILGGAPLSASLQALIKAALDTTLVQGYGMTETLGACLCMDDDDLSYGRCGRPLRGIYARLDDWPEGGYRVTDSPRARGELVIGSKANSSSYLDKPEMNAELYEYDKELDIRWFRTGDIAEAYEDGTFKIIDRKKDLVKLANGEYFSLGKIESILKNCSYVDNICVFGNALANHLVALIVPNQARFGKMAKNYRVPKINSTTDQRLVEMVLKSLRETGLKNGLKKAEIPTKIRLVTDEWTPDNGLLTAALKLKRSLIKAKYERVIEELFTDSSVEGGRH